MPSQSPAPLVSVVVPTYRSPEHLRRCLEGLRAQDADPTSFEVLVVDDASGDESPEIARGFDARLLQHERNSGAAAARNTGARDAKGQILLFLDCDVIPSTGLVQGVIDLFQPGIDAATGRYSPEPANPGRFQRYKALWTWHCWEESAAQSGESSHLQGALSALRREIFEQLGGFDEGYSGGNVEDYELSLRLRELGATIHFDDRLGGRHHFDDFPTVARNYWSRSRMWLRLAPDQRRFSSGQANPRAALGAISALGSALGHGLLPISWPLLPGVLLLDLVFLATARPFLRYTLREEGLRFTTYSACVHYTLSAITGLAALSSPLGRGSRRRTPPS